MRRRTVLVVLLLVLVPGLLGAPAPDPAVASGTTAGASATSPRPASAPASARVPAPGTSEGRDPYWPLDGNGGTDALHYDVRVSYDLPAKVLRGRTRVTMLATQDLSSLSLDLLLPASTVRVDGRRARFSRPNRHELRVVPARPIAAGARFVVDVTYAGRPAKRSYAGERNWLADRHEVVTMNQPHMAPWWFPSNDHPDDKALFDVRVTVPRSKRVVSNGTRVGRVVKGSRATTHWRVRQPMATYLAFFAAGDFIVERGRTASGIPFYNAVSKRIPAAARRSALRNLRTTAAVTDWLQTRFGPYPFASTGGLVTSLDVGFALENQTRPTYGAWIDRSVVVHEIAHQWFGDSLAVRRWRDIWLNEGFATYAEVLYSAEHGGPSVAAWLQSMMDDNCSRAGTRFWTLRLDDPGPARIFDEAVYDRGAMVLAALRNRLGAPVLDALLRGWATDARGANVDVAQFESYASARTGQDLSGFFDAWLRAGTPPAAGPTTGVVRGCA